MVVAVGVRGGVVGAMRACGLDVGPCSWVSSASIARARASSPAAHAAVTSAAVGGVWRERERQRAAAGPACPRHAGAAAMAASPAAARLAPCSAAISGGSGVGGVGGACRRADGVSCRCGEECVAADPLLRFRVRNAFSLRVRSRSAPACSGRSGVHGVAAGSSAPLAPAEVWGGLGPAAAASAADRASISATWRATPRRFGAASWLPAVGELRRTRFVAAGPRVTGGADPELLRSPAARRALCPGATAGFAALPRVARPSSCPT